MTPRCPKCNQRSITLDEEGDPYCWMCGAVFATIPDVIQATIDQNQYKSSPRLYKGKR